MERAQGQGSTSESDLEERAEERDQMIPRTRLASTYWINYKTKFSFLGRKKSFGQPKMIWMYYEKCKLNIIEEIHFKRVSLSKIILYFKLNIFSSIKIMSNLNVRKFWWCNVIKRYTFVRIVYMVQTWNHLPYAGTNCLPLFLGACMCKMLFTNEHLKVGLCRIKKFQFLFPFVDDNWYQKFIKKIKQLFIFLFKDQTKNKCSTKKNIKNFKRFFNFQKFYKKKIAIKSFETIFLS